MPRLLDFKLTIETGDGGTEGPVLFSINNHQVPLENLEGPQKPNIIVFYIDDLGFGDLGVYGATSVATPNVDRLAHEGVRFTDAHSSAATCTPSRYALLTGKHGFRVEADCD